MFVCSEHRSADQTGIIAERGQDQLGIRVAAEGLLLDAPAQRREQLFAIACKTAAEHDALRLKDIDKARKTAREIVAVGFEQLARERVAGVYRVADVLRVEVRAVFAQAALPSGVKRPVRELHEGRRRAVGLQTAAPAAAAPAGAETINAPMPGNIVNVQVKAGDTVTKGQVLLVLEAMKMENEIMAPRDGVIAGVHVNKGDSVDSGKLLISMQ